MMKMKSEIERRYKLNPETFSITDSKNQLLIVINIINCCIVETKLKSVVDPRVSVAKSMEMFIATGNLKSRSGLNLQQVHTCTYMYTIYLCTYNISNVNRLQVSPLWQIS